MSVNKVNKTTGELVTLASGVRMWIGTQSAHDLAVQQGTMPNNCMVCITDDYPTKTTEVNTTRARGRATINFTFNSSASQTFDLTDFFTESDITDAGRYFLLYAVGYSEAFGRFNSIERGAQPTLTIDSGKITVTVDSTNKQVTIANSVEYYCIGYVEIVLGYIGS